jgi:hypothetical protein
MVSQLLLVHDVQGHITEQKPDVNVTPRPGHQHEPAIAVDPSNQKRLVMAGIDVDANRIGYSRSTDGGATWTSFKILNITGYEVSFDPAVAFDRAGTAYIVGLARTTIDAINNALFLARSADGGETFVPSILLPPDIKRDKPWIAINHTATSKRTHITWVDRTPFKIMYGYSTDGATLDLTSVENLGSGGWPIVTSDRIGRVLRRVAEKRHRN